jgi:CheY-like chemotaxis protein
MTSYWVGFPGGVSDRIFPLGTPIVSPNDAKISSVSDWISRCHVVTAHGQSRPEADLIVIYAHALLTEHAFRQDYEGVELLKHLRVANSQTLGDLRRCHIIIVAWESAEEIVRRRPGNIILFSSGVSFLRLPEAIPVLRDHDELSKRALEQADPNDRKLLASVRADYQPPDSAHEMSNWWGAWRLIQAIEETGAAMPAPVRERMSRLSTKQALFLSSGVESDRHRGFPRLSIARLQSLVRKSVPTICYVDDEADQGWEQAFRSLLYGGADSSSFKVVNPIAVNPGVGERVRGVEDLANAILSFAPNLLILDLRLGGRDEASKAPKETSGALLLKEIRKQGKGKGLPILLMTASNKARMLQDIVKLGADAYWMKEGIGEHAPLYAVENPAIELIRLLEALLGDDWQFLLRFHRAHEVLSAAAKHSHCWWSQEKTWLGVSWSTTPRVATPQRTVVLTSPDTANPLAILSQIAALYREYLGQALFAYYGEPRSVGSRDLWLRGITLHAARVIEAVHRFDEIETQAKQYNLHPLIPTGLVKDRGDTLGQEILNRRNGAAHYKPGVTFVESHTRELLGLLCAWLRLDPTDVRVDQSPIDKLSGLMFADAHWKDEPRCAALLAADTLAEFRTKEGNRIGATALLNIVKFEDGQRAALALQCLQPFSQDAQIQIALQERWNASSTPPPLKCHLIWRMGDYAGLAPNYKIQMRSWIFDNFDAWTQSAQDFFRTTPEEILVAIAQKLDARSLYPEHKMWIVICCMPISSEKEAARRLLSSPLSTDEFVEMTRISVLERFFGERSQAAG